jgi:hypothetical protein
MEFTSVSLGSRAQTNPAKANPTSNFAKLQQRIPIDRGDTKAQRGLVLLYRLHLQLLIQIAVVVCRAEI